MRLRGTAPSRYGGRCLRCDREHWLANMPQPGVEALEELFSGLEGDAALADERAALAASPGKMLGVLVHQHGVLRAFSGELGGQREWPGWVPPVMRREDTAELKRLTLDRIARLDAEIGGCDVPGAQGRFNTARGAAGQAVARTALLEERQRLARLRAARRDASRVLSTAMFDATQVTNARGERRPLREIFAGPRIAGGTTDCCVPKLLESANTHGLRPISIVEAWWGPTIGGRHHGEIQPPCERKCLPLLGHLLCGLEEDVSPAARSQAAAR